VFAVSKLKIQDLACSLCFCLVLITMEEIKYLQYA